MRIALYDGPEALTTIDMPGEQARSPKPWEVEVHWPAREGQPSMHRLRFNAVRISTLNADKSIGYTYLATCADVETAAIVRPALVGATEVPGVPPQHVPAFNVKVRELLKAKG